MAGFEYGVSMNMFGVENAKSIPVIPFRMPRFWERGFELPVGFGKSLRVDSFASRELEWEIAQAVNDTPEFHAFFGMPATKSESMRDREQTLLRNNSPFGIYFISSGS